MRARAKANASAEPHLSPVSASSGLGGVGGASRGIRSTAVCCGRWSGSFGEKSDMTKVVVEGGLAKRGWCRRRDWLLLGAGLSRALLHVASASPGHP